MGAFLERNMKKTQAESASVLEDGGFLAVLDRLRSAAFVLRQTSDSDPEFVKNGLDEITELLTSAGHVYARIQDHCTGTL